MLTKLVKTMEETEGIAKGIASKVRSGDIVCLTGDLGAGKTTFTKCLCKALGVDELVNSPTFNIVNEYDGDFKINHFDVYRISDIEELDDIGFDEYIFSDSVSIIEWANLVESVLPVEAIWIEIDFTEDMDRQYKIYSPDEATFSRFAGGLQ